MKDWKEQLKEINNNLYNNTTKLKWIDSHAHYYVRQFDNDRDELLKKINEEVQVVINCGTNTKSNKQVLKLSETYDFCYGVVGYFPCDVLELENNKTPFIELKKACNNKKIVAIGEIGLDYHWNSVGYGKNIVKGNEAIELQKKWFIEQIKFANEMKLPICVHSRDAEEDTLKILKKYVPEYGCVIHCYSYGVKSAKEYIDMGFYFGIGGTSTYKSNDELRKAIDIIPIEQIVLETDAPYLTPEPNKRQRNDSLQISKVITNLEKIKNIEYDDIIKTTNNNIKNIYKIDVL